MNPFIVVNLLMTLWCVVGMALDVDPPRPRVFFTVWAIGLLAAAVFIAMSGR